jgi:hypothetical protein
MAISKILLLGAGFRHNRHALFPRIASGSVDDTKDHHITVNDPVVNHIRVAHEWDTPDARSVFDTPARLWEIARSARIHALFALRTALPRADFQLEYRSKSRQAPRARALRAGPSCPSMFGKDGLYFFVRRNFTAGYRRKRLVDRLKFLGRRVVLHRAVAPRFRGRSAQAHPGHPQANARPATHVFHIRVHGTYLAPDQFVCTLRGSVILAASR